MTVCLLFAALVLQGGEQRVGPGTAAVYSPDGACIAFQCARDGHQAVGVMGRDADDVTWVSDGPGNAAYPAWTPTGELVFTYGYDTNTAYAATHRKAEDGGYNLYLWDGSETRALTTGRTRDYGASVSPDGTLWFVTTRDYEGGSLGQLCRSRIVKQSQEGLVEVRSYGGQNSGAMQPTVSPDGRFLLWSEMQSLRSPWRVMAARVGQEDEAVALTKLEAASYAPRWHPTGTYICYTACKAGDPGWSVYVQDLTSGDEKRVCEGRNPCFSPDGSRLLYDRGGIIYEQKLVTESFAFVSFTLTVPRSVTYVTTRKRSDNLYVMSRRGKKAGDAMAFFLRNGLPVFASRNVMGEAVFARLADVEPKERPTSYVCICGANKLYLYRDGRLAGISECPEGLLPVEEMAEPLVGENNSPLKIDNFRYGLGWPEDVPKPMTRAQLFGGVK